MSEIANEVILQNNIIFLIYTVPIQIIYLSILF